MAWVDEKTASEMLGRKPKTLRAKAKAAVWPVTFSAINGRKYMYLKADLDKLIEQHSNKIKSFP